MTKPYDSAADTNAHRALVKRFMDTLAYDIITRATIHDNSKLNEPEKSVFDVVTPRLRGMTYGSEEYKASLAEMGTALEHHYQTNRHHPEYFKASYGSGEGVRGMNLVDILEMFCDWCAATMRHEDGDICDSIEHNMKRFKTGEVLACIFANTAQEFQIGRGGHRAYPKWTHDDLPQPPKEDAPSASSCPWSPSPSAPTGHYQVTKR